MSIHVKTEAGSQPLNVGVGQTQGTNGEIFNDYIRNNATGDYSHSEGQGNVSLGTASHAEGSGCYAYGDYSHVEGCGMYSNNEARSAYCHVEGCSNIAGQFKDSDNKIPGNDYGFGLCAHVEGSDSQALGDYSHAEGSYTLAEGERSHAEGGNTRAAKLGAHAEGDNTTAEGSYSHAEGYYTKAIGTAAHAEGGKISSDGTWAASDGTAVYGSLAKGYLSHAEGRQTYASGYSSHAEGSTTESSGESAHSEGYHTLAASQCSHSEGYYTKATNFASHVCGKFNKDITSGGSSNNKVGDVFVIGNGTSTSSLSNSLRVTYGGEVYGLSAFNSSGADYAEYIYEWEDNNTDEEDRIGYFVTCENQKIRIANSSDSIDGIVSGNPSVVGSGDEDWLGRWKRDEFNRFLTKETKTPVTESHIDEDTGERIEIETGEYTTGWNYVEVDDYDNTQLYVERKYRPEWDYIGMLGVIPVRDDGTCVPNKWCKCNDEGKATLANERGFDTWKVLERVSDNVVKILFHL